MGGVVPDLTGLSPGMVYVTNTAGQLVSVGYYGADLSLPYYVDATTSTIISINAQVGVAISKSELQIQLGN